MKAKFLCYMTSMVLPVKKEPQLRYGLTFEINLYISFKEIYCFSKLLNYVFSFENLGGKAAVVCGNDSCEEKTIYSICFNGFKLAGLK